METEKPLETLTQNKKITSAHIHKLIWLVLLVALVASVMLWKPWQRNIKANDRTITVTGETTLTAVPDQYVFSPSYTFTDADQQTALSALKTQSAAILAKLKALGVADSMIASSSSGYTNGIYVPVDNGSGQTSYDLSFTITITNKDLAQKIQDYLVTTSPTGDISPTVTFTTATQKSLQDKARNLAEQDAKSKADQSAKNLGFKVEAVKSVQDGNLGSGLPIIEGALSQSGVAKSAPSLSVQPGENQLSYSVTVVYYIH
jgi:uncharacterized protein YggE